MDRVWPWAITDAIGKYPVCGCEVGLQNKKHELLQKRWCFQIRGSQELSRLLAGLRCSHDQRHVWTTGGVNTKHTEDYPYKLAAMLVLGAMR